MTGEPGWRNKLYFGDNLVILREHVQDESVDLVYLDPHPNSVLPSIKPKQGAMERAL